MGSIINVTRLVAHHQHVTSEASYHQNLAAAFLQIVPISTVTVFFFQMVIIPNVTAVSLFYDFHIFTKIVTVLTPAYLKPVFGNAVLFVNNIIPLPIMAVPSGALVISILSRWFSRNYYSREAVFILTRPLTFSQTLL